MKAMMISALLAVATPVSGVFAQEDVQSSFAGLGWSIGKIPLGQDMKSTMIDGKAGSQLKRVEWAAKNGTATRPAIAPVEQFGHSSIGVTNIQRVSDRTTIAPADWHTGQIVMRVERKVSSRKPELMPTSADVAAAARDKYGADFVRDAKTYAKGGIGQQSFSVMAYPISNGEAHRGDCYDVDFVFAVGLRATEKRYNKAKEVLQQIQSGTHCEALLAVMMNEGKQGRLRDYRTVARDFRVEAINIINDVETRIRLLQEHQDNLPKVEPKL